MMETLEGPSFLDIVNHQLVAQGIFSSQEPPYELV
jgi:hypothetical protein